MSWLAGSALTLMESRFVSIMEQDWDMMVPFYWVTRHVGAGADNEALSPHKSTKMLLNWEEAPAE